MDLLGWTEHRTAQRYALVIDPMRREAMARMGGVCLDRPSEGPQQADLSWPKSGVRDRLSGSTDDLVERVMHRSITLNCGSGLRKRRAHSLTVDHARSRSVSVEQASVTDFRWSFG